MGAWGCESCSNDSCWDHLDLCKDIHNCTEKEIEDCLAKYDSLATSEDARKREVFLGVVVWGLTHKSKVATKHLESAFGIAADLLKDSGYLSDWRSSEERMNCLLDEIKLIKFALKNDGLPPQEITSPEGLLEKMLKIS
jgi:hypothetical protein